MKTVKIIGGKTLRGSVPIVPNKNAILPAIAASLLSLETITYTNVPQSPDVQKMLAALASMGAVVTVNGSVVTINCKQVETTTVPSDHIRDMQAGYLFAGPLLARFGEAIIPISSGCKLGYRGHEDHASYFEEFGITFQLQDDYIRFVQNVSLTESRPVVGKSEPLFQKKSVSFDQALVTPTENVLMMLALSSGYEVELSGIAQEPHVEQLIAMLKSMGVRIQGKGSTITIFGADRVKGTTFTAEADHIDYFGFMVTAVMTKSDLLLKVPVPLSSGIHSMNRHAERIGIIFQVQKEGVLVQGSKSSFSPNASFPRADAGIFKMNPGPWPGFPVDSLPSFIALSTMNQKVTTSTRCMNWMYTGALKYVQVLKEMGAHIPWSDDQRALIQGFSGNPYGKKETVTSPDVIEGARAVISSALCGTGEYTIQNVQYILRRNPEFFEILKQLGAAIEVIE